MRERVLDALFKSNVNVLDAVRAGDDVAAKITSNAAEVSRSPNVVVPVKLPPVITGFVASTGVPVPDDAVHDGTPAVFPETVCCRK